MIDPNAYRRLPQAAALAVPAVSRISCRDRATHSEIDAAEASVTLLLSEEGKQFLDAVTESLMPEIPAVLVKRRQG